MIYGYVRVSNRDQNVESQKNLISRYCIDHKLMINEWIEVEMSSRNSTKARRIDELFDKLQAQDTIIVSELSRLGRSIKETLNTIEKLIHEKQAQVIFIKQSLEITPLNKNNITNKVLITVFSMIAECERDFISERTKAGLDARRAKGIKLGKPKGIIQASMYDQDKEGIFDLYNLGVPLKKIIKMHIKYGKYYSLKEYINKRLLSKAL